MPGQQAPRLGKEPVDVTKPPTKTQRRARGSIYKALSPSQMEEIANLRAEGMSTTEIREKTGIAVAYISGYILSAEGTERVNNIGNNLKFEWGDIASLAVGEIHERLKDPDARKKMGAKDLNYTAAIATDKFMDLHEKISKAAPPTPGDEKRFSADDIKEFLNSLPHAMKDGDGENEGKDTHEATEAIQDDSDDV